jgi:hypothetical protein
LTYLLAQRVVNQQSSAESVKAALTANEAMAEDLSRVQQHSSITGATRQYVDMDFRTRISSCLNKIFASSFLYSAKPLFRQIGLKLTKENDLSSCVGSRNDTVAECPIFDKANDSKTEFVVLAHNA